jgi:hypothetical protein
VFVRSAILELLHDLFVDTVELVFGPLFDTPLKSLHGFGLVWVGGGTLLIALTLLVANYRTEVIPLLFVVVMTNLLLMVNLPLPYLWEANGFMYAQIAIWILPFLLFFCEEHLEVGFGVILGLFVCAEIIFGIFVLAFDSLAGSSFLILG